MERVNPEGLTWPEWAYAAGIAEPTRMKCASYFVHGHSHDHPGYAQYFRKERRAWRHGEDPTEWRARV